LGHYDRYLVAPAGSPAAWPGFKVCYFPRRYFGSAQANSRLMLSREFYARFRQYDYILIHHLDALVFRDELPQWCAAGYDFIGAPWYRSQERPEEGFVGVGNGGLSLRRVSAFLRVLSSPVYTIEPALYRRRWEEAFGRASLPVRLLNAPRLPLKRLRLLNGVGRYVARYRLNEDHFWADEAAHYYPDFRIAPPEVAIKFAFEQAPSYSYELLGGRLPFGCHGWARNDRAFWEPFLPKLGRAATGGGAMNQSHA
jgi:hypothetical protein